MAAQHRKIGGEFSIDPNLLRPIVNRRAHFFSTGRGALHAIVHDAMGRYGIGRVLLPDYLCNSMIRAVADTGCPQTFYPVDSSLKPDLETLAEELASARARCLVVVIDYFGLVDLTSEVEWLRGLDCNPIVVVDEVQSPFTFEWGCPGSDYAFTSYRKALPAPDGAVAVWHGVALTPKSTCEAAFVRGKIEGNLARDSSSTLEDGQFLWLKSREAEDLLDRNGYYDCAMSEASTRIVCNTDIPGVARRRQSNFDYLARRLSGIGIFPIVPRTSDSVPLFLPVLLKNRDHVRSVLAQQDIYCPVHWPWPEDASELRPARMEFWEEELSMVIDQRYDEDDMDRLADALEQALGVSGRG